MIENQILFKPEMVRAILDGRKTMTRRALKPQPVWQEAGDGLPDGWHWEHKGATNFNSKFCGLYGSGMTEEELKDLLAPTLPYAVGDILWVRENGWERPALSERDMRDGADTWPKYAYDADDDYELEWLKENGYKRRPSIHMPRWACRIRLRVTAVKVERLQDISAEDAKAEGCGDATHPDMAALFAEAPGAYAAHMATGGIDPVTLFEVLWESINGPGSWEANPWVAAYSFERVT